MDAARLRMFWSITLVWFFCLPAVAYAYIDPGVGSMILQGIIAALAGVLAFFRFVWWRRKGGSSQKSEKQSKSDAAP